MKTILVVHSRVGGKTRIVDDLFGMGFDQVRGISLEQFLKGDGLLEASGIVVDRGESFSTFLQVAQFVNTRHPVSIVLLYPGNENESEGQCLTGVVLQPFCDLRFPSLMKTAIFQMNDFCDICHEKSELQEEIEERKVVEKAKWVLVKREGMSEDAAYKRIRKSSMTYRRSMKDVAMGILADEIGKSDS